MLSFLCRVTGGSEWKRYYWSGIQPLSHRRFLIKGIKALVCPFAVLRSRFGLRYSRVRGRRQSKFLASSSTGGARNFYPSIRSEAPSFIVARAAKPLVFGAKHQTQNVVRQSRTNILPKMHRGAENALSVPTVRRTKILSVFCCRKAATKSSSPCKQGEPRFALRRRCAPYL